MIVDRIPVTTVARTLVDLSDEKDANELAFMIHEAAYLGKFSFEATQAAMERANGRRNLERAQRGARTASERQRRDAQPAREALPPAGAGRRTAGTAVQRRRQRLRGRLLLAAGLCVEIDGPPHERPRTQVDDRIRDAALRAAGYVVLRFSEDDLNDRRVLRAAGRSFGGAHVRPEGVTYDGRRAGVVELADTPALGAGAERCGGSSPSARIV